MSFINDVMNDFRRTKLAKQKIEVEKKISTLAPNEAKGFRLPIIYGNDSFTLSDKAAWTGFQIPSKPWGYLSEDSQKKYFRSANNFFAMNFPSARGNQGHIIVTNHVYSPREWENKLVRKFAEDSMPLFENYVRSTSEIIAKREFFDRETYMFVRMGDRNETNGLRGWLRSAMDYMLLGATGLEDTQPDDAEIHRWADISDDMFTSLSSSWVAARAISRRRVEWLVRHLDSPSLPTPEVSPAADEEPWGIGEWRTTLSAYTQQYVLGIGEKRERYTGIKFTSPSGGGVSYAAFLPLGYIRPKIPYNRNWIHHASSLDFPVDISLRFEVIDSDRTEEIIKKPLADAEAQQQEDNEAGHTGDEMTEIQQSALRTMKAQTKLNKRGIARWQAVFAVSDTDPDELRKKIIALKRHYKDIDFILENPSNDQRELFYQSFPGGEIEVEDWIHRSDTEYLAASQPWLTSHVGDNNEGENVGLYMGYTIAVDGNGQPKRGAPVFYDLLNVVDQVGTAPTEAVAAESGAGKTVSRGLRSAYEDALRGITQMIWDPKGDFLALFKHALWLRLDPKKLKLINLRDYYASVSLDTFGAAEVDYQSEEALAGKETIDDRAVLSRSVLFQLLRVREDDEAKRSLIRAAVNVEIDKAPTPLDVKRLFDRIEAGEQIPLEDEPCLEGVLDTLQKWSLPDSELPDQDTLSENDKSDYRRLCRNMHGELLGHGKGVGKLLFNRPSNGGSLSINKGDLVLFVAINLKTTQPGDKPTEATILGDIISGMMADYIRSLLYRLPDHYMKCATFDEWHVIKRSNRAEALVSWMRRMGRSKRCMLRQMSQSARDFFDTNDPSSSRTSLSTVWCGLAKNKEEAEASCDLLGIERSEYNLATLQGLGKGQFLFRDIHDRVALVQIEFLDDDLLEKFNTTAKDKADLNKGVFTYANG